MKKIIVLVLLGVAFANFSYLKKAIALKIENQELNSFTSIPISEVTCKDCHSKLFERKNIHAPVSDDCSNCHANVTIDHPNLNSTEIKLVEELPILCYSCHDQKNTDKNIHAPVESGECLTCHSAHSSDDPFLLTENSTAKLCSNCHDTGMSPQKKVKHAPVEFGECLQCHDPHQSNNLKMLKNSMPNLCFDCHDNLKKDLSQKYVHTPIVEECGSCHKVHESTEKILLLSKTPDLCYSCHESYDKYSYIHGPVKNGDCTLCHSPHASSRGNLLKETGKALCLGCHNKEINTTNRTISNVGQKIKSSVYVHGVIEMEGCIPCHSPHGSDFPNLLTNKFPTGEYSDSDASNFSLCFDCHDKTILQQGDDPLTTKFRNGSENLHFVHVNGKKGRNCKVCHDTHSANNKHLIAEKVKFGNWDMPLNYKSGINGGSCATGCHAKKVYVNNTY